MAHPGVYLITAAVTVFAGLFVYFSSQNRQRSYESRQQYQDQQPSNKSNEFVAKDNECTICYETIRNDFEKTYLRCGHHFHNKCITRWFSYKEQCPNCRLRTSIDH